MEKMKIKRQYMTWVLRLVMALFLFGGLINLKHYNTSFVSNAAATYTVEEIKMIKELFTYSSDYFLLDTTEMNLTESGSGPDWSQATTLYEWNTTVTSNGWKSSLSGSETGLSTREQEIITTLKGKNIVCWKLDDAQDTDSLLFVYTNDWTSANGNHYYKTANYTASALKGNLYTYGSTFSFSGTAKMGYNIDVVDFEKSLLSGKTVYFNTGTAVTNPKIKLVYSDGTSEEVDIELSYKQEYIYEYNFPDYVLPDTVCYFSADGGSTYVPTAGFEEIEEATPCYNLENDVWEAFTPEVSQVEILVMHDFADKGGATVIFTKNGVAVSGLTYNIGTSSGKFTFDLTSTEYDGFYIKQDGDSQTGNTTEIVTKSDIEDAIKLYSTPLMATVGDWVDTNTARTLTLGKYVSIPDQSLDIPEGTYTKENDILYAKATFYDYYSDVELTGTNRNTLTGSFIQTAGSDDKLQARTFNSAISNYFSGTSLATSTTQSPLYFGEFTGASTSDLVNFIWENNNGTPNNSKAKQGLVNDTLVNGQLVMGTDNIVAPYFSEGFLRGNNSTGAELGYVFENVEFPFVLNDNYWEFDSYNSDQTLRIKQTAAGEYFLDRVGSDNLVKGYTSTGTTTTSGFFPFNDKEESGNPKQLNYAFGVKLEIPFYMTSNGKVTMDTGDEDITFEFQGDDDVWIFIDDELILDIGGNHGAVQGTINFATLEATTSISTGDVTKTFDRLSSKEQHTLTMFYMERGLWESNMYLSFNFPQSNKLEIEKEVDIPDEMNPLFDFIKEVALGTDDAEAKVVFPVSIDNLVTSGKTTDIAGASPAVDETFDDITDSTAANLFYSVTGAICEVSSGGEREQILKYSYPGEKGFLDGQDVTDKRSTLIEYAGTGNLDIDTDQMKNYGYLEFDAYVDMESSDGAPFVALIDANGNRIGAWATEAVYEGTNGNMKSKEWTTLKLYLNKMYSLDCLDGTAAGTFDYGNIVQIQFAHWSSVVVYLDNFHIKAPIIYNHAGGFTKDQDSISDYGSYAAQTLMPATGAAYILNPSGDGEEEAYEYVDGGYVYLRHNGLMLFKDQFRRESYISIKEHVDTSVFNTSWVLYEDNEEKIRGDGLEVEDNRTEESPDNSGTGKPSQNTILFKKWDNSESSTSFFDLKVKYTNKLRLGNLTIVKQLVDGQAEPGKTYKVQVTFSNVAGMEMEGMYQDDFKPSIVTELEVGTPLVIDGIPAGTRYRIKEIIEDTDDYQLKSITALEGGNDVGSIERSTLLYYGYVTADEDGNHNDVIVITNDLSANTTISGTKEWIGNAEPAPESVTLKLYRKLEGEDDSQYEEAVYSDGTLVGEYVMMNQDWTFNITGIPKYQVTTDGKTKYVYKVVETKINDKDVFNVNTGYEISGGLENQNGEFVITNTYSDTNLAITKVDAEDNDKVLDGVVLRLEKMKEEDGELVVDDTFNSPTGYMEGTTDSDGKVSFEGLSDGNYRLTEVQTYLGYSLLANPVPIEINRFHGCTVDGEEYVLEMGTDTISIKITNQLRLSLPMTGSQARSIMIGLGTLIAGFGIVFSIYNIKNFKREREQLRGKGKKKYEKTKR